MLACLVRQKKDSYIHSQLEEDMPTICLVSREKAADMLSLSEEGC